LFSLFSKYINSIDLYLGRKFFKNFFFHVFLEIFTISYLTLSMSITNQKEKLCSFKQKINRRLLLAILNKIKIRIEFFLFRQLALYYIYNFKIHLNFDFIFVFLYVKCMWFDIYIQISSKIKSRIAVLN
jgi:hypothetical protein